MRMVLLTCVSIGITSVMRPAFSLSLRAVGADFVAVALRGVLR